MERLTERLGDYNNPKEICAVWVKNHDYVSAAHRLADYEDITDTVGGFDRLCELAEADKDGRLVVLPCKVGDTVYFRTYDCNGTVDLGIQPHKVTTIVGHAIVRGRYTDVGLLPGQYGVSWFLTREEAEKALEAMKNE